MRKMFSKNQIKRLIEDDISNVTVTKGQYTTGVSIKLTKVGHCITIMGYVEVNNTSGASISDLTLLNLNNLELGNIDGDLFNLTRYHNSTFGIEVGHIDNDGTIALNNAILPGVTEYYFDIDLIDSDYLPVEGE